MRPQSSIEPPLAVCQYKDPRNGWRENEEVVPRERRAHLNRGEQIQAEAREKVESSDHVSEEIGDERVASNEFVYWKRLLFRVLLPDFHGPHANPHAMDRTVRRMDVAVPFGLISLREDKAVACNPRYSAIIMV